MIRIQILVFVGGLVSLTACNAQQLAVDVPDFACTAGKYAVHLPATLPQLRKLSKLVSEDFAREDHWEGYKTTEKWLRFDGLSVRVTTFSNSKSRYLLEELVVSSPRWTVTGSMRVGMPVAPLFSQLGATSPPKDGEWKLGGHSPESLFLTAKAGKIERIAYACYTG